MRLLIALLSVIGGSACDDSFAERCFEKLGKEVTQEIVLLKFTSLEIEDDLEVELVDGAFQKVTLTTFEEVMSHVVFTKLENGYRIENSTTCLWNKHYKSPKLTITSPDLSFLVHRSTSPLYSKDTVRLNKFWLALHLSFAPVNLILKTDGFVLRHYGRSDIKIAGTSNRTDLFINEQASVIDCSEFQAKVVVVEHGGLNDMKVFPLDTLRGSVNSIGNVIYFNKPEAVKVDLNSSGKLLLNKL